MTQPTPGPSIQSVKWDGKFTVVYELSDGTSSAFRCVPAMGRLIAAAPELLEALANALENIEGCLVGQDLPSMIIRDKARAAIRKARGQ